MLDAFFIPAKDTASRRLCVFLHGLGDSVEGYDWLLDALGFPWMNYVLANAPDSYYSGFSWYDFAGDIVPGVKRSCALLSELLDATRARGFPSEQTILGGFSQGGLMTLEVGCRYPHRLAGLVEISGYAAQPEILEKELSPVAKEQRFLATHGIEDPILPIDVTRNQIKMLQTAGLNIEWHEFHKGHTLAGEPELAVIRKFIEAGYC